MNTYLSPDRGRARPTGAGRPVPDTTEQREWVEHFASEASALR